MLVLILKLAFKTQLVRVHFMLPKTKSDYQSVAFVACFTCTPDSIELVNWGTWHRCWRWGSIVEWRNLVTGEKLHWS